MAGANTTVFSGNTRILFRDLLDKQSMTFSGQLIGIQVVVDGDGCDLYFDLDRLEIVAVESED
jgi:hypothetical protein